MNNFKEVEEYLSSFINYEKHTDYSYQKSFRLDKVRSLMNILSVPYTNLKAIHIAGTKGKGSTATFISYILAASGYKVGLYTSPHFYNFRERIKIISASAGRIKESLISEKDTVRIVNRFRYTIDNTFSPVKTKKNVPIDKRDFDDALKKPTFFEICTAVAFMFFLESKVDLTVLETGLGGRLDATNIVNPLISIITRIGYDHTQKLGEKLKDIAYEKAGIIKEKVPLVTVNQRKSALCVILKKSRLMNSDSFVIGKDFGYSNVRISKLTYFDFSFGRFHQNNLCITLKGRNQIENASLAAASVEILRERNFLSRKIDFRKGFKEAYLEGRFEVACKNPLIVLDVAHNELSFRVLSDNIKDYFPGKEIILIFAVSKDKNVKKMLSLIEYSNIIITSFNNPRALSPYKIKEFCKNKDYVNIEPSIEKSLRKAKAYYNKNSLILITGSFFLVSEAKKALKR